MITDWTFNKLRLFAVLYYPSSPSMESEGWRYLPLGLDVSQLTLSFQLNSIPQCSLVVTTGRNLASGRASTIHHLVDVLRRPVPIQIWAQAGELFTSLGVPLASWPNTPFVLFEGEVVAKGFTRRDGQAAYVLTASHWLSALAFSSALSRSSHVTNPSHYYSPAALKLGGGNVAAIGGAHFVAATLGAWAFSPAVLRHDFWGGLDMEDEPHRGGLLDFFYKLTEQDLLHVPELNIRPGREWQGQNFEARAALERFEPLLDGEYVYGVPLSLRLEDASGVVPAVESAIAEQISGETFNAQAGTTLWDKLVGAHAPEFLFSVVPMIDRALVVPFLPGLRQPWQIIYAEDYAACQLDDNVTRPLRGVGLFTGVSSWFGGLPTRGASTVVPTIGGYFPRDNPFDLDGLELFRAGPQWLSNLQASSLFGMQAAAPLGIGGLAQFPRAGLVNGAAVRPDRLAELSRQWLDEMARAVYIEHALRGRTGLLTGRPRLDIAPGSNVEIRMVEEKFVMPQRNPDLRRGSLYGSVTGVTLTLDADSGQAATTFALANLRTSAENEDDRFSYDIDEHPLWGNGWLGAPLHSDDAFLPAASPLEDRQ